MMKAIDCPLNVVLIDDDEDDYVLLLDMLTDEWNDCFVLEWQPMPKKAVKRACSKDVHLVIVNSNTEHTPGIELIEKIVKNCDRKPIIFLTDQPDSGIIDQAFVSGAAAVLHKGKFTSLDLELAIRSALSVSRTSTGNPK